MKEVKLQKFWLKLLIILSSAVSVHEALAVPLSSLLNNDASTSSLVVDTVLYPTTALNQDTYNLTTKTKLNLSLLSLVKDKLAQQIFSELPQFIAKLHTVSLADIHWQMNAQYCQCVQLQQHVFIAVKALQKTCLQRHVCYQADRKNLILAAS